jgi:hypothetical protein
MWFFDREVGDVVKDVKRTSKKIYEFVRGMDTQKLDFERGFTSYAAGLTSNHGWWWYYGYCLLFKGRLVVWGLFLCVLFALIFTYCYKQGDYKLWDETVLVLPAIVIFVFVSMNTGFSEHSRYIIPMLPFVYIFLARTTRYIELQFATFFLVLIAVAASLLAYPNYIAYFGFIHDEKKTQYLIGSNVDWGQSVYEIKEWCDTHVEARPRYVNYTRSIPFEKMAIKDDGDFPEYVRKPGWMIISCNDIYNDKYKWILKEKPVEILGGGSVLIYYLEP